ncbi:MAG: type II secretion system protein, partial [Victivallales bacterium]
MYLKRFFTIIELLVSVAIIAILFSLVMPAFTESREKARFARWLQFNKQCSSDPTCVINLNFQDDNNVLVNSAQGYQAEGFNAADYRGIIKGSYEWGQGRWHKNKRALIFDGLSTYIEFSKSKYLNFSGSDSFTMIAWVKFDLPANSAANGIFSQCYLNSDTSGYSLYFAGEAPGTSEAVLATADIGSENATFNNQSQDAAKSLTIDNDNWFQIVLRNKVVNGNQEISVFLNGTPLKSANVQSVSGRENECKATLIIGGVRFQTTSTATSNSNLCRSLCRSLY